MYVPILKFRQTEKKILKNYNDLFSDKIIPLIEIFSEDYKQRYEINPETGKRKYTIKNGRKKCIKIELTDEDICTVENLINCIQNKKAFIDYLRIDQDKYKPFDESSAALGINLRNLDNYYNKLLKLDYNEHFIPVVSTRKKFNDDFTKLSSLVEELKLKFSSIAFRVTANTAIDYKEIIEALRESDYLLYDIEEINYKALMLEFKALNGLKINASRIILSSPRHASHQNKDFEEDSYTNLIDNSIIKEYSNLGFSGFGDYAGYKDVLPSKRAALRGSALCLMYDLSENKFWAFTNKDTSLGFHGYTEVKKRVLLRESALNYNGDCIAYDLIHNQSKIFSYSFWIQAIIIRYIDQIGKNINKI